MTIATSHGIHYCEQCQVYHAHASPHIDEWKSMPREDAARLVAGVARFDPKTRKVYASKYWRALSEKQMQALKDIRDGLGAYAGCYTSQENVGRRSLLRGLCGRGLIDNRFKVTAAGLALLG